MATFDDLGTAVTLPRQPLRVVSLVPSLTESVAMSAPQLLVGATDWCTRPAGLQVARVRGTKNPDLAAIRALRPDLVLANREENRRLDVQRLRADGIAVWVTVIETVAQAFGSLRRLFADALGHPVPGWLSQARAAWDVPCALPPRSAVIPVWRDPWLVVGSTTFTGDLASRLNLGNVFGADEQRYPRVELAAILARSPDLAVLPDEPYLFTADDGPEALPGVRPVLVSGRDLTWYGPSLVEARARLEAALAVPPLPAAVHL